MTEDGRTLTPGSESAPDRLPRPSSPREWARQYARSAVMGWRQRAQFTDVERFCFFVGYPRSGHSLVGSLLNAHPEMLIAHELDALGHVEHHFSRRQVYALLLERDEVFASMGRRWTGYDYQVEGQFQGRWTRLRVIGDKRGRDSTFRLGRRPELLERLRRVTGVGLGAIHITRNPYDNIATMARHQAARHRAPDGGPADAGAWVGESIDRFQELCAWIAGVRPRFAPGELFEIPYEEFVAQPAASLSDLCTFLGVDPEPSYIAACAGLVWPGVRRTRDSVSWSDENRRRVDELIATYRVMGSYSWDR